MMLPVCSSPALHLKLSLPKNQQKPCPRPDTSPREGSSRPPGDAKWSVGVLMHQKQGFGVSQLTFGGKKPGREEKDEAAAPPLDLGPSWCQIPYPRGSPCQRTGTEGDPQPPNNLSSCRVPLKGLGPPSWLPDHSPCDIPAMGDTGQTGAFPPGRWAGDVGA